MAGAISVPPNEKPKIRAPRRGVEHQPRAGRAGAGAAGRSGAGASNSRRLGTRWGGLSWNTTKVKASIASFHFEISMLFFDG